MMSKFTAIVVASALALGAVGIADAHGNFYGQQGSGNMMGQSPCGGQWAPHNRMFNGMNLTNEQQQEMQKFMQGHRNNRQWPSIEERRQLHNIIASDNFDKQKAQSIVDSMETANKARMMQRLEEQNHMYNILTPEQKKQFNANFDNRLNQGTPAPKAQ
ncbi:ATP-independent periplasmic protein-refolding chaperone Spy [Pectobacteriaceae bacterium CE70]|nr:ATP-independent periplasmic protein-refolding chaperone Spy [Pectobacteriaceae bacterium C52]WJV68939.1 ATP-independent periplasmic protein-refolding chaperone Spy [Pectobacteriaceae bacterium CE70]WJY12877.1 ATP-independent periplasmic protein-refolding chaperone Spy [Pectobacteriaceae bacterium C80]